MKNRALSLRVFLVTLTGLCSGFPVFPLQQWAVSGYNPSVFSHDPLNEFRRHVDEDQVSKKVEAVPKPKSSLDETASANSDESQSFVYNQNMNNLNFMLPNFPDDGAHSSILYAPWGNTAPMFSYSNYLGNPFVRPLQTLWSTGTPLRPLSVPGISRSLFPMPQIVETSSRHFEDRRPFVKDDEEDGESVEDNDDDDGDGDDFEEDSEQRRDGENERLENSLRRQIELNKAEIEHEEALMRQSMQIRPFLPPYLQPSYDSTGAFPPLGPAVVPLSTLPLSRNISPALGNSNLAVHGDLTVGTDGRYERVRIPRGWGWKMDLPGNTHIRVS